MVILTHYFGINLIWSVYIRSGLQNEKNYLLWDSNSQVPDKFHTWFILIFPNGVIAVWNWSQFLRTPSIVINLQWGGPDYEPSQIITKIFLKLSASKIFSSTVLCFFILVLPTLGRQFEINFFYLFSNGHVILSLQEFSMRPDGILYTLTPFVDI